MCMFLCMCMSMYIYHIPTNFEGNNLSSLKLKNKLYPQNKAARMPYLRNLQLTKVCMYTVYICICACVFMYVSVFVHPCTYVCVCVYII